MIWDGEPESELGSLALADLDGDGRPDLVAGAPMGGDAAFGAVHAIFAW